MDHSVVHLSAIHSRGFSYYKYEPSLPAAVIFVILFLGVTFVHVFLAAKHRAYFFIPLVIGGFFEWTGYIGRALAHSQTQNLGIFIMQTILLLVAPALFAASIYMTLGRIILFVDGENHAPIRARWLTKIFVIGDVLSFFVQAGGGGLMANDKSMNFGKHLVVIGLFLQIVFFGIFITASGVFHFRIVRSPTPASLSNSWQSYVFALYGSSALILIRSLFRVAEFSGGINGGLMRNELYIYIFDGILMFAVLVIFALVHPGYIIGRRAQSPAIRLDGRDYGDSSERWEYGRK